MSMLKMRQGRSCFFTPSHFINPRISVKPVAHNQYSFYKNGYEFYAEGKTILNDKLVLYYRGSILNSGLSLTIQNDKYDFESCEKRQLSWVCKDRISGNDETFASPLVTFNSNQPNIKFKSPTTYSTYPSSKNLQHSGRIYLSYEAPLNW